MKTSCRHHPHTPSSLSQFIVSTPMESNGGIRDTGGEAVGITRDFWLGKDTSICQLSPLSGRRGAVTDTGVEQHGKYTRLQTIGIDIVIARTLRALAVIGQRSLRSPSITQ